MSPRLKVCVPEPRSNFTKTNFQDFTVSSNDIAAPELHGSPETSVLSSPTGDATRVGELPNCTFAQSIA